MPHPKQNIIRVYYAPAENVNFTYKALTFDNMTAKNPLTINGGHVDPTYQPNVSPFAGTGTSTGFTHPGFKFDGWYHSTTDASGTTTLGEKVDSDHVKIDPAAGTATLTVPKDFYIYIQDEEYSAVYVYDDTPFEITYKTSIKDANGQNVTNSNVKLQYGSEEATADPITKTFTNRIAAPSQVTIASTVPYYSYQN